MALAPSSRLRLAWDRVQWGRGARAGIAVAAVMVVCHLLGRPIGWISLGVLQVLTVDNGGPYRSRLGNILTVILGGSLALFLGVTCAGSLPLAIIVTAAFCFTVTLARVIAQPLASASISIMVAYVIAYGGNIHTIPGGLQGVLYFVIGALWASCFSLILWPLDPFKPARHAIANLYAKLTQFAAALPTIAAATDRTALNEFVRQTRVLIETAQTSLAATPARMTARTVRARNLAAMVQAADLLFARLLRLAELSATNDPDATAAAHANGLTQWLVSSLSPIEAALRDRPADNAAAFTADGSRSADMHRRALRFEASLNTTPATDLETQLHAQFRALERDCLLSLEVVYESLRAIWTGAEPRATPAAALRSTFIPIAAPTQSSPQIWLDALRANFTTRSVMFRHALRLAAVTSIDVVILHLTHLNHGYWLPMTSIIVLQPYTGETWQRSGDRVAGTVAGAVLAAILAATVPSQWGIITVISIAVFFTLAVYAVDYAWYCFFLTPTIVLLTLPHLRDWHFAAVRMGMTGLGALVAILAMLILWPERESIQIPGLLARAAAANAAYLRAVLKFWQSPATGIQAGIQARTVAERTILAPARRACGLAANDAEESLDRALLEHAIPLRGTAAHERLNHNALTFTTCLRRLSQSTGTLAIVGQNTPTLTAAVAILAARLDTVSTTLTEHHTTTPPTEIPLNPTPALTLAGQQITRIERQINILERAATDIATV